MFHRFSPTLSISIIFPIFATEMKPLTDTQYIRQLVSEGEHCHQDFKFEISDARKIARSLSAFANTEGGRLLVGVKDNGKIAGIRSEEEIYMIEAAATMYCCPKVEIETRTYLVEGKSVLEVSIGEMAVKPVYALDEKNKPWAYIRIKDENILAVKAGFANGAHNTEDFKRYSFIGMALCTGFMACSAIIITLFPAFLIGLFTKDAELIKITVPVVAYLGIFQVFDGLQIALAGVFKGLKNTKIVFIANFTAYWLISIPLGYTLAFKYGLTLLGFWISLIISAITLCVIMLSYFVKTIKKLEKLQVPLTSN